MEASKPKSGSFRTEYTDNYQWGKRMANASTWDSGLFGQSKDAFETSGPQQTNMADQFQTTSGHYDLAADGVSEFHSQIYPSIYRETVIHKDDRGKYIDQFKNIANKPYGRRLMYDESHPDKMYALQWNSELADPPGCYSFPTTTGLPPQQPFTKDLSWQMEGEQGQWPTEMWKQWTEVALSPTYDGHSDQPQYSQYKVQVP